MVLFQSKIAEKLIHFLAYLFQSINLDSLVSTWLNFQKQSLYRFRENNKVWKIAV